MSRPLVGVSTAAKFTWAWPFLALSVWLAGGRPRRITPESGAERLDGLKGLVVGGGDDIGAEIYGGKVILGSKIDPGRDRIEQELLHRYWPTPIPILGICRGAQMMNVVRGGTLHADIYEVYEDARRMRTPLPLKTVRLEPGSNLARISGQDEMRVNSIHHQSVDKLGEGLSIAAHDTAGVVQAVEDSGAPFRIGVQWHPEFLFYARRQRRLWKAMIKAANEAEAQTPKLRPDTTLADQAA